MPVVSLNGGLETWTAAVRAADRPPVTGPIGGARRRPIGDRLRGIAPR